MENITRVIFGISESKNIDLYRYDRGQYLEILDVPDGAEAQFEFGDTTINSIIQGHRVQVPDGCMDGDSFKVWIQYITSDSMTVIKTINVDIKDRIMPASYVEPEDQPDFRMQMQAIMDNTAAIAQDLNQKAEAGYFNGRDGSDGAPGPQGPIGPQGPQGPAGPKGDTGAAGPSYDDTEIRSEVDTIKADLTELDKRIEDVEVSETEFFGEYVDRWVDVSGSPVGGIYSEGHTIYNPTSTAYMHLEINAKSGDKFRLTGYNGNNTSTSATSRYPLAILFDNSGSLIDKWGTDNKVVYENLEVEIPSDGVLMVNGYTTVKRPYAEQRITGREGGRINENFEEDAFERDVLAERGQFEQLINPLKFKTFDKSYITFTWDDGNAMEAKTVYDIFHEFGMPVNFSLPVSSLSNEYDGQTMLDIAKLAIADGGEVFSHNTNSGIITIDNCKDEFVHKLMKEQKQGLLKAGISSVRGCMLTGGTGQIVANNYPDTYGKIMDKWVRHYYDFSDLNGFTDQYYKQRSNLNNRLGEGYDAFIQRISGTGWIHFMAHRIDNATTEPNITSAMLRQVLTYISQHSDTIQVVNASYIYDHFSSK